MEHVKTVVSFKCKAPHVSQIQRLLKEYNIGVVPLNGLHFRSAKHPKNMYTFTISYPEITSTTMSLSLANLTASTIGSDIESDLDGLVTYLDISFE
jgi:hypothetical protein|tara:strand:+ start:1511 stop:1798 length:288 start_codon:yes stop_codon:yes gene_type:complete